jgi:hypothetical protein
MENNPLKQYFRRPNLYIKLPSQYRYYDDTVAERTQTGELPVYPMTNIDEITVRTPDALYNGVAVHDVIRSCVPQIKDPWKIVNIDLNTILIAIKIASNGNYLEVSSSCPSCAHENTFDVDLGQLMARIKQADYDELLNLGDLKVKFKPLTYAEVNENNKRQFEIQKLLNQLQQAQAQQEDGNEQLNLNITEVMREFNDHAQNIITSTIEYIQTPETRVSERDFIVEFLKECDKKTSERIRDFSVNLTTNTDIPSLDSTCQQCENEYTQRLNLNVSDFFG